MHQLPKSGLIDDCTVTTSVNNLKQVGTTRKNIISITRKNIISPKLKIIGVGYRCLKNTQLKGNHRHRKVILNPKKSKNEGKNLKIKDLRLKVHKFKRRPRKRAKLPRHNVTRTQFHHVGHHSSQFQFCNRGVRVCVLGLNEKAVKKSKM